MQDENYFILIKPSSQSPAAQPKGTLNLKVKYKNILESMIDKHDMRNLLIAYANNECILSTNVGDNYSELSIYFEDWRKCQEVKQAIMEDKRRKQIINEKNIIEKFLIEDCENEVNNMMLT
jgi:hypothetical protein